MKLKDKKTGKIIDGYIRENGDHGIAVFTQKGFSSKQVSRWYSSLFELNTEWTDGDGTKKYYYFDDTAMIFYNVVGQNGYIESLHKEIGNYFETKEEAEAAVEKLKAWKRLRDKGFRFGGWYDIARTICFKIKSLDKEGDHLPHFVDDDTANDLDLLFGGEDA